MEQYLPIIKSIIPQTEVVQERFLSSAIVDILLEETDALDAASEICSYLQITKRLYKHAIADALAANGY